MCFYLYKRAVDEISLHPDCVWGTTHNRHIWKCGVLIKVLLYGQHYNTIQDRGIHYWYTPGRLNRYQSTVGKKRLLGKDRCCQSSWKSFQPHRVWKEQQHHNQEAKNKNPLWYELNRHQAWYSDWEASSETPFGTERWNPHRFILSLVAACRSRTSGISNNRFNLNNALGEPLEHRRWGRSDHLSVPVLHQDDETDRFFKRARSPRQALSTAEPVLNMCSIQLMHGRQNRLKSYKTLANTGCIYGITDTNHALPFMAATRLKGIQS